MKISEDLLKTYIDLSPEAHRLIEFLETHPQGMHPLPFSQQEANSKVPPPRFPLQPWPILVGREKLQQIQRATLGIAGLILSIPERIFDNDPQRLAEYYGLTDPALTASPPPPNGFNKSLARGDFIDTEEGFRCVEMNVSANLGGLDLGFWETAYRRHPALAEFLDQEKIQFYFRNPLGELFSQVLKDIWQGPLATEDGVGVLLAVKAKGRALAEIFEPPVQRLFSHVLRQLKPTAAGECRIAHDPAAFSVHSERLYYDGRHVHGFINYSDLSLSDEIYRCFKAGNLMLYNTPQADILSHKSSLALLSEHSESDLFDSDEKSILRDHVPWCRKVDPQTVSYQGKQWRLPELLEKQRESFVLKESWGFGGQAVIVGRYCTAEEWRCCLDDALRQERSWVAQEFLTSRPYLFPSGEDSCCIHDVVWGLFCFGNRYGSGFLRMMPREGVDDGAAGMVAAHGVVNSKRGASEGLLFEV